jgi:hypothetical protein
MLPLDEPSLRDVKSILLKGSRRDQRNLLENIQLYIAEHHAHLNRLVDMEASLVQALSEYRYSNVAGVPAELLREIFLYCAPTHGRFSPSRRHAPMVLMHVCRRWRQVATGFQPLWSSLCIDLESLHKWRELVMAWFERSGVQTLSLTIKPPPGAREAGYIKNFLIDGATVGLLAILDSARSDICGDNQHPDREPYTYSLGYLNGLCPKIKRLEVDINTRVTSLTFLRQFGFEFGQPNPNPNLHHLALHAIEDIGSTLAQAPNLQTLQITHIREGQGGLHLRSATLRKLCISDGMRICMNSIHNILDSCPSLVHLELVSLQKYSSSDGIRSPREYSKLEHLGLHLRDGLSPLLETVKLPGLRSLACGEQNWTEDDVSVFKMFLEASQCQLTSFRGFIPWYGLEYELASWSSLLDTLSFVQMLELEIPELTEPSGLSPSLKLVTALLPRLPRLEEVRLKATSQVEPRNREAQWPVHVQRVERLDYFYLHSILASKRLRAFKLAIQTRDTGVSFEEFETRYCDISLWCPTAAEEVLLHDLIAHGLDFVVRVDADPSRGPNHHVVHFPPNKRIGKCNTYGGTGAHAHLDLSADYYEEELLRIGSCSQWPN